MRSPDDTAPTEAGPKSADENVEIDMTKLSEAIAMSFTPASPEETQDRLEPIADDLHHLMQRVHMLEQGQTDVIARLELVAQAIADNTQATAVTLDRIHREMLGDRRVTVDRRVLAALGPALDSLWEMQAGLPMGEDSPVSRQMTALIGIATNALRRVGFTQFEPAVGDPFDPTRMEALRTAAGQPGTVLGVLRCGYLYGQGVERPAGVILARPEIPYPETVQPVEEKETT